MKARSLCAATAFTAAILVAMPAFASKWLFLRKDGERDEYVDTTSFVRSGTNVKVWNKTVFARPQHSSASGRAFVVQLALNVYSCERSVATPLAFKLFSTPDQTLLVEEHNLGEMSPGWDDVRPGTVFDKIRTLACQAETSTR